jgi:hypothetical protein
MLTESITAKLMTTSELLEIGSKSSIKFEDCLDKSEDSDKLAIVM